jgi:hypothetical protein
MAFIEPPEGTYHQKVMRVVSSIMSCFARTGTRCEDIAKAEGWTKRVKDEGCASWIADNRTFVLVPPSVMSGQSAMEI